MTDDVFMLVDEELVPMIIDNQLVYLYSDL